MTKQQYFDKLGTLIDKQKIINEHFHNNFLECHMNAKERNCYVKKDNLIFNY